MLKIDVKTGAFLVAIGLLLIACITLGFRLMAQMKAQDREIKTQIEQINKRQAAKVVADSLRRMSEDSRADSIVQVLKVSRQQTNRLQNQVNKNTREYEELDRHYRDIVVDMPPL